MEMTDLANITQQRRVYGTANDEYAPPAIVDTLEELGKIPKMDGGLVPRHECPYSKRGE